MVNESSPELGDTRGAMAAGWYEDPEAADLLRWWDGREWSETEFRAKPEDSALVAYAKSYQDLSPRSPTNYLAVSSLFQACVAFVVAAALLTVSMAFPPASSNVLALTLLVFADVTVAAVGLWATAQGVLAVQNARRFQGKRIGHAIAAILIAIAAVLVSMMVLVQQFPIWLDGSGLVG